MRGRTRRVMGAMAAAAVVLAAGCGGGSGAGGAKANPVARAALVRASTATQATRTATFTLETTIAGATDPSVTFAGHGSIDFEHQAVAMTLSASGQTIEQRMVADFLYLELPPALSATIGSDKPWVKLSLSQMGGVGTDPSGTGMGNDPGAVLQQVESVSDAVTSKPGPTIGGAATTRYDATIDLKQAVAKVPNAAAEKVVDKLGIPRLPVSVFVDGQGRVVRITETVDLRNAGSASGGRSMALTLTFADFGAPVAISAPPADQVTDFKELSGSFGSNFDDLDS